LLLRITLDKRRVTYGLGDVHFLVYHIRHRADIISNKTIKFICIFGAYSKMAAVCDTYIGDIIQKPATAHILDLMPKTITTN